MKEMIKGGFGRKRSFAEVTEGASGFVKTAVYLSYLSLVGTESTCNPMRIDVCTRRCVSCIIVVSPACMYIQANTCIDDGSKPDKHI